MRGTAHDPHAVPHRKEVQSNREVPVGMRISELRGLSWEAVDFDRNTIRVFQRVDEYCEIGLAKFGSHVLWHAVASLCHEQGWNPKEIQTLLGHPSIPVTRGVHGHLVEDVEEACRCSTSCSRICWRRSRPARSQRLDPLWFAAFFRMRSHSWNWVGSANTIVLWASCQKDMGHQRSEWYSHTCV